MVGPVRTANNRLVFGILRAMQPPQVALAILISATAFAQTQPCKSTVTGTLDIVGIESSVFHNERYLRIWLPPGYSDADNAAKLYPVLYMLDGQILFDGCTATGDGVTEYGIDETLTRLIGSSAIPPLIVVGIDQMGASRPYEFLPYRNPFFGPNSAEPDGKRFPDFLATDVIPVVAKRYRITKGPQAIGGSSYGAAAALYALINRPDLFDRGLIESPSIEIGNGQLLRDTQHLFKAPSRVYLGTGDSEFLNDSENQGFIKMMRILESNLKDAAQGQVQVLTVVQPGAKHNLAAWSSRFAQAIQFIYGL
jgi:predicted alpha/beta superfamily hydrolase